MKKIAILMISLVLGSCGVDKNLLTAKESNVMSSKNDTIFYSNTPVAVFTHYEIELYKGETSREICLSALDIDTLDMESLIIKYVHTKHPNDKVQFTPIYKEYKVNKK